MEMREELKKRTGEVESIVDSWGEEAKNSNTESEQ